MLPANGETAPCDDDPPIQTLTPRPSGGLQYMATPMRFVRKIDAEGEARDFMIESEIQLQQVIRNSLAYKKEADFIAMRNSQARQQSYDEQMNRVVRKSIQVDRIFDLESKHQSGLLIMGAVVLRVKTTTKASDKFPFPPYLVSGVDEDVNLPSSSQYSKNHKLNNYS